MMSFPAGKLRRPRSISSLHIPAAGVWTNNAKCSVMESIIRFAISILPDFLGCRTRCRRDLARRGPRRGASSSSAGLEFFIKSFAPSGLHTLGEFLDFSHIIICVLSALDRFEAGADVAAQRRQAFVTLLEEAQSLADDLTSGLVHDRGYLIVYEIFQLGSKGNVHRFGSGGDSAPNTEGTVWSIKCQNLLLVW